ncbi:MAG: ATP-binding cassette domain-containing protein [Eubacteriales bacterium]
MKLMYELDAENQAALDAARLDGERLMYCVPFNIYGEAFVKGYTAVTDRMIYCLLDGRIVGQYELARCADFSTEVMYGNCAFYTVYDGSTTMICRFISGRNLPRYSVLIKACEMLAERAAKHEKPGEPITNSEPERFCPKCGRPFIKGTMMCPFCRSKKEVYKKLWGLTKGLRLMLMFPLVVAVFSVAFQFIVPAIQKVAVNEYITNASIRPVTPGSPAMRGFIAIIAAIVSIDLFQRLLSVIQGRLNAISGNKFTLMMRALLYEKIQNLSLASISNKSTGDLMGRITGDVGAVQSFMTGQLPNLFIQVVSFILAIFLLFSLDPLMSLFVFVPIPLVVYLISKFWETVQFRNRKSWMLNRRVNQLLQDTLNGIRVVKTFGSEEREIERFDRATDRSSSQNESNAKLFDTIFPLLGFAVRFGSYLILFYGNFMLFNGDMTVGALHQFNSYANIIYGPLMYITFIPRNISNFLTSLGKVLEILEEQPEVSDISMPIDIRIEGDISFKNVTFGYETYNPVLENITFDVKKGEMIGIVGHSGSGKTTLINLLMRLYDVTEGAITIDDVNIKDISQNALRSQIGVVLQETHLFSGSIRDNIRYSKPLATDEEVVNAARLANAHDFIVSLPEGYNTIVGEKGYSLSGGERQRIAIARALIHDPQILILDEATAALDTETEKLIQDAINKLTQNRTTFAIAHRLSTLRNADRLIVLDRGKLVEYGTHQELLALKGFYWRLVMAQRQDSGMVKKNDPAQIPAKVS